MTSRQLAVVHYEEHGELSFFGANRDVYFSNHYAGGHMSRKGWLLFIAISIFWGIPYFFIKVAVSDLDPAIVVFARIGIAAIVLLPVAFQRKALGQFRGRWPLLIALAFVHLAIPFLLISYGEQHISSSLTSLLIASEPLLIALFAFRFDPSERVRGLRLLGLFVGLGGVVTLLGFDISGDSQKVPGAVLVLLAATGYAASALLAKQPSIVALPRLGVVTVECSIATIILLPLAIVHWPTKMPTLPVIASLLALGLVCTALALLTFFALIAEVGASRGAAFTYVNPAVSVLLGVVLLNEGLNIATLSGFLLIILGSWLSTGGTLPSRWRFWAKRDHSPIEQEAGAGREAEEGIV
jgi:drug/metabolite transporter (DMT)-like permease